MTMFLPEERQFSSTAELITHLTRHGFGVPETDRDQVEEQLGPELERLP